LILARDLVRGNAEVRRYLQQRFTTSSSMNFRTRSAASRDPSAAELGRSGAIDWHAVVPKPGKLFVVGDPKQSVYKFRRADAGPLSGIAIALARGRRSGAALRQAFAHYVHFRSASKRRSQREMQDDWKPVRRPIHRCTAITPAIEHQAALIASAGFAHTATRAFPKCD